VNARARSLLPVVLQRQTLSEHLAKLLDRLGLDRAPQKTLDLGEYLAGKYGQSSAQERQAGEDAPTPADTLPDAGDGPQVAQERP
jgi:hypothetical protein